MTYCVLLSADFDKSVDKLNFIQDEDPENTYLSPFFCFSHLSESRLSNEQINDLKADFLTMCDGLFVLDEFQEEERFLIDLAKKVGMPIETVKI